MSRVVVDIETIGVDFESLDEKSQDYLLKYAESDVEKKEIKEGLGLHPLTGEIVAIGLLNPDTDQGVVYFQNQGGEKEAFKEGKMAFESGKEKEILEKFWADIDRYDQMVTFNGRAFDAPYLHLRSAILKVVPSRNLMPYRYDYKSHCDLMEQLTFYGATRRKFNLHLYARSFGIKSPKEDGVDGLEVSRLYREKKFREIAQYCLKDLVATKELYQYWDKYMRF